MAKTYKSVYTIFDKVKKGEVVNTKPSLFSNISYNLKNEVVKPHLHYIDESALQRSIRTDILNLSGHELDTMAKQANIKIMDNRELDELKKQIDDIYKKFPKSAINDIFNVYHKDFERLEFEKRTDANKYRFKLVEKSNNPVTKVITKNSHLKSMVFSRSFMRYYLMMLAALERQDKQAFDDLMDQLKNQQQSSQGGGQGQGQGKGQGQGQDPNQKQDPGQNGSGQQQDPQDQQNGDGGGQGQGNSEAGQSQSGSGSGDTNGSSNLENLLKKIEKSTEKLHDKLMDQAKQTAQQLDKLMSEEEMQEAWDDLSGNNSDFKNGYSKTDPNFLKKLEDELRTLDLSMSGIKNKIKHLLDKSVSYFSAKEKPIYESIFDADSVSDIQDYELFHPKLKNVFVEDIMVKEIKKMGKVNIYVDVSGSMHSGSGLYDEKNHVIPKSLFAKAFVYKMKQLNMLNKVYSFENNVKAHGDKMTDILAISGSGGTDLNKVVNHINQHGQNAIILTDAEDNCAIYSDLAYFIGVSGANFGYFNDRALKQYVDKNQLCVFDGNTTYSVDKNGSIIKK